MITRRTKLQLVVFAVITLLGVSFVGARYAQLTRLVSDQSYTVTAHFKDSGGIFQGGEVTYRGVRIGQVSSLQLTDSGVDVNLDIENAYDTIPADTLAIVGNRSAVGEQYVELQPQTDSAPYLKSGSQIAQQDTQTPIQVKKILTDITDTVGSIDRPALRTSILQLGTAFDGTGRDLQRILDTGNSFINTANDNIDTTASLLRDANVVLGTQVDKEQAIRTFANQLSLFSRTLAVNNPSLKRLIDNGSVAAAELRSFLEQNRVELGSLINNLVTTGKVVVKHLPGIAQILVIYPYVVEGGFTVVSKSPDTGLYDAHFGLVLTNHNLCHRGYNTQERPPQDGSNKPMNTNAHCAEPPAQSNARGAQNLPGNARAAFGRSPVVATYDPTTHKVHWGSQVPSSESSPGTVAPRSLGEESWKWLYLQPLTSR